MLVSLYENAHPVCSLGDHDLSLPSPGTPKPFGSRDNIFCNLRTFEDQQPAILWTVLQYGFP